MYGNIPSYTGASYLAEKARWICEEGGVWADRKDVDYSDCLDQYQETADAIEDYELPEVHNVSSIIKVG